MASIVGLIVGVIVFFASYSWLDDWMWAFFAFILALILAFLAGTFVSAWIKKREV